MKRFPRKFDNRGESVTQPWVKPAVSIAGEIASMHREVRAMRRKWIEGLRRWCTGTCVVLALGAGLIRAGETEADLRRLLEQQSKQIVELKKRLEAEEAANAADSVSTGPAPAAAPGTDPIKT